MTYGYTSSTRYHNSHLLTPAEQVKLELSQKKIEKMPNEPIAVFLDAWVTAAGQNIFEFNAQNLSNSVYGMALLSSWFDDEEVNKEIEDARPANEKGGRAGIQPGEWNFTDRSRFLHSYFINKLNTDLHGKTAAVENKNGLELYRQICNIMDAMPANFKFYLDSQFTDMPRTHAPLVKGLKELYMFRILMKSRVTAYKKAVGVEPSHDKLKEILWELGPMGRKQWKSIRDELSSTARVLDGEGRQREVRRIGGEGLSNVKRGKCSADLRVHCRKKDPKTNPKR